MPYITEEDRMKVAMIDVGEVKGEDLSDLTPGEFNYFITTAVLEYLGPKPNYGKYNEVVGVLECAKLEFYRRAVTAYEEKKIQENGDVY